MGILNTTGVIGTVGDLTIAPDTSIYGTDGMDYLYGDKEGPNFNDVIYGYGEHDELFGLGGNDHLYGGWGFDELFGGDGNDVLHGEEDDDRLYGEAGIDTLYGGSGNDTLYGGAGADALDGGTGFDLASYELGDQAVSVNLATGTGLGGDAEGDLLANIEGVIASNFDDTLTGSSRADTFFGLDGDDHITGRGGHDTIDGGNGDDTISGGGGNDVLYAGYDHGNASESNRLSGGGGNDALFGTAGRDVLNGGTGDDTLTGHAGNDKLVGGGGDDLLIGGKGRDVLTGGAGFDTFQFNSLLDSGLTAPTRDLITDFTQDEDVLDFSGFLHNYHQVSFAYIGQAQFSGQAGELRSEFAGSNTMILGDVDGDGTADFRIDLTGNINLTVFDFDL